VVIAANPELAAPDAARTVSGDLDNIVLMAMRKEPARRYVSVSALAADVKAYLTGYPVNARTDTWKYRSGKFVRRHKIAVAAALIVALALVGFSIGMGLLAKRAARETDRPTNSSQPTGIAISGRHFCSGHPRSDSRPADHAARVA
jgi:eukaryotic-like serine/threonine-protein kinase